MAELGVCVEARQNSADPAMNRHAFRSLDNKAERLGVDHVALAQDGEGGESTGLPLKRMNKGGTSGQAHHSAGMGSP
jgi:hypothetical protein